MKKAMYVALLLSLLMIGHACGDTVDIIEAFDEQEEVMLKIGHVNSKLFDLRYKALLNEYYPNISYEIVDAGLLGTDDIEKWVEVHEPDIIFFPSFAKYQQLVQSGYLLEMDSLIQRDDFDIDAFVPNAVELLKTNSRHKIYGLSSHFSSQALLYNKMIFDAFKVPYPTNNMTWAEVIALAHKFPNESLDGQNMIGLYNSFRTPGNLILQIGYTEGLSVYDSFTNEATINTPSWQRVWQDVFDGFKSGAIHNPSDDAPIPANTAMYVGNFIDYKQLLNSGQMEQWGIVSMPINHSQSNTGGSFQLLMIASINEKSVYREASWEVLKFIHGDIVAHREANSHLDLGFFTREKWNKTNEEHSIQAFYSLMPDVNFEPYSSELYEAVVSIFDASFRKMIKEGVDVDTILVEANASMQQAGRLLF